MTAPVDVVARPETIALGLHDVHMRFGGTYALRGVDVEVRAGTISALLGANGSGKSTLIKILAGVHRANSGRLDIYGRDVSLADYTPAEAASAGLRFVHQDLGLFDALSVAENFALDAGYPTGAMHTVAWRALRARVRDELAKYELDIDPKTPIHRLRASDRTMVAIARALQGADDTQRILVLDEPTATLAEHESELLLNRLRKLAAGGQTIIIVSHRLREVLSVADDFTVLRDGVNAARWVGSAPTEEELIAAMAGGAGPLLQTTSRHLPEDGVPVAVAVEALHGGPLRGVSLQVRRGEIVGLAGLVGSGRTSLLEALFGVRRPSAGTITVNGRPHQPRSVADAKAAGVGMVPEHRVRDAAFMDLSVRENLSAAAYQRYWQRGWMRRRAERHDAARLTHEFHIKVPNSETLFSTLSGGNQQKVIIARWLRRSPRLLLLDEPTQGVDVMSRAEIYATIRDCAARGCATIVASSDANELHTLCDRVVILHAGRVWGEVAAADVDIDQLTALILREPPAHGDLPAEHDNVTEDGAA